jgi:signal peptidase I
MTEPVPTRRCAAWIKEARPLLVLLLLLGLARTSFANHYQVPSGSMQPTLYPGDRVVVDMTAYGLRVPFTDRQLVQRDAPRRGEVVVFKSPADGTRLIKRVVAVAGDRVQLVDGQLSIHGTALASPGAPGVEIFGRRRVRLGLEMGGGPDIAPATIPEGKLLVLGDHRGNSADGRVFGLIDAGSVYARAVGVYWRTGEGPVWKRL